MGCRLPCLLVHDGRPSTFDAAGERLSIDAPWLSSAIRPVPALLPRGCEALCALSAGTGFWSFLATPAHGHGWASASCTAHSVPLPGAASHAWHAARNDAGHGAEAAAAAPGRHPDFCRGCTCRVALEHSTCRGGRSPRQLKTSRGTTAPALPALARRERAIYRNDFIAGLCTRRSCPSGRRRGGQGPPAGPQDCGPQPALTGRAGTPRPAPSPPPAPPRWS